MKGESLAAAALTFAAVYGVDLLRMPAYKDLPVPEQTSFDRPQDLTRLEPFSPHSGLWADRLAGLSTTVRLGEKKVAIFETLCDPLTSLGFVVPHELLVQSEQNHQNFVKKALKAVTASLIAYAREAVTTCEVDGVVLEIRSATYLQREPHVFEELVKPHLKELLNEIRKISTVPIWLHFAGRRLYLENLLDLPHDLISWPHLSSGPALDKLPRGYKGLLAGGLDDELIPHLSYQGVRHHVEEARNAKVALFALGDSLPADMSRSRLEALATFLNKRDRLPEAAGKAPTHS